MIGRHTFRAAPNTLRICLSCALLVTVSRSRLPRGRYRLLRRWRHGRLLRGVLCRDRLHISFDLPQCVFVNRVNIHLDLTVAALFGLRRRRPFHDHLHDAPHLLRVDVLRDGVTELPLLFQRHVPMRTTLLGLLLLGLHLARQRLQLLIHLLDLLGQRLGLRLQPIHRQLMALQLTLPILLHALALPLLLKRVGGGIPKGPHLMALRVEHSAVLKAQPHVVPELVHVLVVKHAVQVPLDRSQVPRLLDDLIVARVQVPAHRLPKV
mmetsp:Transcript_12589/g.35949  ORF Transcript_12589/g.35949 Transcript_12589/m.35949 type:complete len:265 (+) Transcript_12589:956-1750(+)